MESICTELALYGSINEFARTDNVFFPISEVCDDKVSLGLVCGRTPLSICFFVVKELQGPRIVQSIIVTHPTIGLKAGWPGLIETDVGGGV